MAEFLEAVFDLSRPATLMAYLLILSGIALASLRVLRPALARRQDWLLVVINFICAWIFLTKGQDYRLKGMVQFSQLLLIITRSVLHP